MNTIVLAVTVVAPSGLCLSPPRPHPHPQQTQTHEMSRLGRFSSVHTSSSMQTATQRSVANDMAMHRRFLTSTQSTRLPFLVPHSYKMLQAHDPDYPGNLPDDSIPCETYIQERIPPLPLSIRSTLINLYCPPSKRGSVRNSKKDEDCLVRLYCGKRRSTYDQRRHKSFFTLRNYGLYIDQMEHVGIDIDRAVTVLANSLANCYWVAHIDANDSEWVFGLPRSSPAVTILSPSLPAGGFRTGGEEVVLNTQSEDKEVFTMRIDDASKSEDMTVWMLDFDCVRPTRRVSSRQSTHSTGMIRTSRAHGQTYTQTRITKCGKSFAESFSRGVMRFWEPMRRSWQPGGLTR